MKLNVRQCLLTVTLAAPVVFAIATEPAFVAETHAQGPQHMLGPNFPVRIDTNGDGQPGSSDTGIVPVRSSGGTITIPTPWDCGSTTDNVITLSNPDGSGRYLTATRNNGTRVQSLTAGGFVSGSPRTFSISERIGASVTSGTTIILTDNNSDGVPDGALISGNKVNGAVSFVFSASSDAVSLPWSQASALGIDPHGSCAGTMPQEWIPLADTNGDGRGDAVVFDLDGNGVADSDLLSGPALTVPSVPAMGPVARLILLVLIGGVGCWFLSRRPVNVNGAPAT